MKINIKKFDRKPVFMDPLILHLKHLLVSPVKMIQLRKTLKYQKTFG